MISRAWAKQLGLKTYFTAEPCPKGHVCPRRVASKACVECQKEYEQVNLIRKAYNSQKHTSDKRGIQFLFSYNQWIAWWKSQLGPNWFELRGPKQGHFVMARNGDTGPYVEWNVKCVRAEGNHKDRRINGTAKGGSTKGMNNKASKLNDNQALFIFNSKETPTKLSRMFGVSIPVIDAIKKQTTWKHVTAGV